MVDISRYIISYSQFIIILSVLSHCIASETSEKLHTLRKVEIRVAAKIRFWQHKFPSKNRNISQKGVQSTVNKKNQKKLFVKPDQNPVRCSKAICFCTPTFLQDVVVKDVEYLHIRIAGPHVVVPSALHPVHQRRPAEAMKMDTLW